MELVRKKLKSGYYENWGKFLIRKTCGLLSNGKKSECLKKYLCGENNPKWRGGLPKCKMCGERTAWYAHGKMNPQNYCKPCFNKILADKTRERMGKLKGIYPKSLIPFAWKKGHQTWNKIGGLCHVENCDRKYLAKGLCKKHYQSKHTLKPSFKETM